MSIDPTVVVYEMKQKYYNDKISFNLVCLMYTHRKYLPLRSSNRHHSTAARSAE